MPRNMPPSSLCSYSFILAFSLVLGGACQSPDDAPDGAEVSDSADQAGDDADDDAGDSLDEATSAGPSSADAGDSADDDAGSGAGDDTSDESGDSGDDTGDSGDDTGDSGDDAGVLDLPTPAFNYSPELPAHYRVPLVHEYDNTSVDNPITDAGATLGRVLFYDTALSANETVACASCHQQELGFADDAAFSEGFAGGLTGRNSMGLADARWYASGRFFWDERAATLEEQVLGPIQNEVEMGLTLGELVTRVGERGYYRDLFAAAFGDEEVTSDRISRALAQFVRAMSAHRSRFDVGLASVDSIAAPFPNFTQAENQGKAIFLGPQGACGACHLPGPPPGPPPNQSFANEAIFSPIEPLNNGLDAGPVESDNGVGDVTGDPQDNGLFKSHSLRNIAVTGPYMHDGRFATLAEVVDHYDHGVQAHPNLDPRLRGPNQQPRVLNLSPGEKAALVAFLGTLTDDELLTDPRFADPFIRE